MPEANDWLSWERYESALVSALRGFTYFIISDTLRPYTSRGSVLWRGRILCEGGFEVTVDQRQDVRRWHGRVQVRTARYSYQVLRRTISSVEEVVRYDNFHVHPGHPDAHHVHRNGVIEHVGAAHAPALVDVLAEAESWWRAAGA